ncbi:MAG TPA: hypothetical protein VGI10_13760 [Polyangiaceae bacterium]|jgi:hypothetical protein
MNITSFIFPLLVIGLGLFYRSWMMKRSAQALADAGPSFNAFFERTGYRYADLQSAGVEAQTARALADARNPQAGGYKLHYVRNYYGLPIHYTSSASFEQSEGKNAYVMSNAWSAELPAPPRFPIHIADKRLDSTLKAVGEAFSHKKRVFSPKCSQRVTTGIAAIDERFVVFADNPQAVQAMLAQNPSLVELLGGWAEVDVAVTANGAVFADPEQKNMQAAMGGMIGSMAMGFDYGKRTELSIPVHERVAELLATLARAAA